MVFNDNYHIVSTLFRTANETQLVFKIKAVSSRWSSAAKMLIKIASIEDYLSKDGGTVCKRTLLSPSKR